MRSYLILLPYVHLRLLRQLLRPGALFALAWMLLSGCSALVDFSQLSDVDASRADAGPLGANAGQEYSGRRDAGGLSTVEDPSADDPPSANSEPNPSGAPNAYEAQMGDQPSGSEQPSTGAVKEPGSSVVCDCAEGELCDPSDGACRPAVASKCGGSTPVLYNGACVECDASHACSAQRFCNLTSHTCVPCLSSAQCTLATAPVCDSTNHICTGCTTDADCAGRNGTRACDTSTGSCVACASDADCAATPAKPLCAASTHTCVACTSTAIGSTDAADRRCTALASTTPYCVLSGTQTGQCRACDPAQATTGSAQRGCEGAFCVADSATCQLCDPTSNTGCVAGICRVLAGTYACVGAEADPGAFPGGPPFPP